MEPALNQVTDLEGCGPGQGQC